MKICVKIKVVVLMIFLISCNVKLRKECNLLELSVG